MVKPSSRGRQKLEMKRIQNKTSLGVTFTKRRNGIFKKANELVTLCGATLAIIIFSPGKKAFSFGHPTVYAILNRFMHEILDDYEEDDDHTNSNTGTTFGEKYFEEYQKTSVGKLYNQYHEIQKLAEIERKRAKENKDQAWCSIEIPPRDQLSLSRALQLRAMLQELKFRVSSEIEKRFIVGSVKNGGILNDNFPISDGNGKVEVVFKWFDAPGASNIPGLSYGLWNL